MALRPGQSPAQRKAAFPPSVDADTRLLILGSLPGDASIRQGEYYAHRGNAFWTLMGDVLGEDLRGQPYAMRLNLLRARGVGLWDVIESAQREGSLDGAIRAAELRDAIARLQRMEEPTVVLEVAGGDRDVVGYARDGDDAAVTILRIIGKGGI